jgi:hypothetical protein
VPACLPLSTSAEGALIPQTTNVMSSTCPPRIFSQSAFFSSHAIVFVISPTPSNRTRTCGFFSGSHVRRYQRWHRRCTLHDSHDPLKVKFQVSMCRSEGSICRALCDLNASEGWQAVWARMSRVMRAVGGFTFSCASALSSPHCWTSFLRTTAAISLSGARLTTRPLGFSIPSLFRRIEFTPFQHYTCFMPHSSVAYSA